MPLSNEEIEKIYNIKEKLLITYKASKTESSKKRIHKYISNIDRIIKDIENGKQIDPKELNIFSSELKNEKIKDKQDDRISYVAKIENIKISETNKDAEMDLIYSFFKYFENNFAIALSGTYLKIDYYLNKKRELVFAHYENVMHLVKEYIEDLKILNELKFSDQIEQYKLRLSQEKNYLLLKMNDFLLELKEFLLEIISDLELGNKSLFNPDEKFKSKFTSENKSDFDEVEIITIIYEALYFVNDFLDIIRIPDFKKT
jgi:hypothetical protein